ncbi:MAG: hypothetical protein IPG58_15955 [Acidobacteria bacterium]|nr:hypothetical protein [Acidobacteriota bacterium]
MKNIQNGILIAVTLLFLTGSNPAQIAQNQEKAKSVAISDTQPTVKALPSDREKELLERIERLEKRLTELEKSAKTPLTTDQRVDTVAANSLNISAPVTATPPGGSIPTKDANAAVQDKPKLLEEGIIPHSIRIPGTDLSLKFSGYVKADFIQDFQGIGNRSQFATNSIPIDGTSSADIGAGTNIQARESRISLELVGEPGKHQFRAYVEGDFAVTEMRSVFGTRTANTAGYWLGRRGAPLWMCRQGLEPLITRDPMEKYSFVRRWSGGHRLSPKTGNSLSLWKSRQFRSQPQQDLPEVHAETSPISLVSSVISKKDFISRSQRSRGTFVLTGRAAHLIAQPSVGA